MFEPQGIAFFVLLLLIFAGLLVWLAVTKQIAFRVLAACLAFIPAMLFGVAAVNRYYNYYQTWGSIKADFTNQGVASQPQVPHLAGKDGSTISRLDLSPQARSEATQTGYLFETVVKGPPERDLPHGLYLSAAAVLPGPVRQLPVPRHRAAARLTGQPGAVDRPDEHPAHAGRHDGRPSGRPGGAGHAGHQRRPGLLAAVPQRGRRGQGRHLRGAGRAQLRGRQLPGAAAGPGLGLAACPRAGSARPTWPSTTPPGSASPA